MIWVSKVVVFQRWPHYWLLKQSLDALGCYFLPKYSSYTAFRTALSSTVGTFFLSLVFQNFKSVFFDRVLIFVTIFTKPFVHCSFPPQHQLEIWPFHFPLWLSQLTCTSADQKRPHECGIPLSLNILSFQALTWQVPHCPCVHPSLTSRLPLLRLTSSARNKFSPLDTLSFTLSESTNTTIHHRRHDANISRTQTVKSYMRSVVRTIKGFAIRLLILQLCSVLIHDDCNFSESLIWIMRY